VLVNALKSQTKFEHLPQTQIPKETNPILFPYLLTNSSKAFAWKLESLTKSLLINIDDESFGLASPKRISSLVLVKILKSGFLPREFSLSLELLERRFFETELSLFALLN
jgi:hypothetical protein